MRAADTDSRTGSRAGAVDALRRFQQHWTSGRRVLAPVGILTLIGAVALSALLTSGSAPRVKDAAATRASRPNYLLPVGTLVRDGTLPDPVLAGDRGQVGVPPGTPAAPVNPPAGASGSDPAIAPYGGAAGTLTPAGIATLALEHGCAPGAAVVATAIAMAESGGSPSAQGDIALMTPVWDWSAGLWQIRGLRSERNTGGLRDSVANQAVDKNAAAMQQISQGCTDWTPWSTYNSGAYLQFLGLAQQAVRYVVAYYNAHGHHYPAVPAPDPNATIPSGSGGSGSGAQAAAGRGGTAKSAPTHRHKGKPAAGRSGAAAAPSGSSAAPAPGQPATGQPGVPGQPAPVSTANGGGLPLPLPTKLPTTVPPLPVPVPSTSLPLPLPLPTTLPPLPHLP